MSRARIYLSPPHMSGREQSLIADVFESNWVAPVGPDLAEFEQRFAEKTGVKHAAAVSSGTAALHLALHALDLDADSEVICSTFTFCASANPIIYEGAKPVFIDSDRGSWNIDPSLLDDELKDCARRGKLPKAVMVVDILGQSADMDVIHEITDPYEIPIIEDAAEALGATYKDRPAGASGWASAFSFNGNKIITTSGGGMLCSNDRSLIDPRSIGRLKRRIQGICIGIPKWDSIIDSAMCWPRSVWLNSKFWTIESLHVGETFNSTRIG